MGATTLEVRLRWRLVAVMVPALGAIALAAVLVTSRSLQSADDASARAVATGVARTLAAELAEGDAPAEAEHEATRALDPTQARVKISGAHVSPAAPIAATLLALPSGSCASADDFEAGWRGCCVTAHGSTVVAAVRTDTHRAVLRSLIEWMAAAVVLALLGALFASRVALRAPLRALRDLAEWATSSIEGDHAPTPAPAPRDGTVEIEHMARRFDALVGALTESLARERACTAHIAHELRTPLAAMVAELDAAPATDAIRRMRGDAERLARVIDAILVLSTPASVERTGTIVNVADVARKLAPVGWTVEAPDEALVEAEPDLVELALRNLVENASKYAPAAACTVRVSREADRLRVAVIDEGPGVPETARGQMFERYWRDAKDGAGRGLGLALVRAVAERSGGAADARAGSSGAGLDVGFSLGPVLGWNEA